MREKAASAAPGDTLRAPSEAPRPLRRPPFRRLLVSYTVNESATWSGSSPSRCSSTARPSVRWRPPALFIARSSCRRSRARADGAARPAARCGGCCPRSTSARRWSSCCWRCSRTSFLLAPCSRSRLLDGTLAAHGARPDARRGRRRAAADGRCCARATGCSTSASPSASVGGAALGGLLSSAFGVSAALLSTRRPSRSSRCCWRLRAASPPRRRRSASRLAARPRRPALRAHATACAPAARRRGDRAGVLHAGRPDRGRLRPGDAGHRRDRLRRAAVGLGRGHRARQPGVPQLAQALVARWSLLVDASRSATAYLGMAVVARALAGLRVLRPRRRRQRRAVGRR